jgi:hypothetical protein
VFHKEQDLIDKDTEIIQLKERLNIINVNKFFLVNLKHSSVVTQVLLINEKLEINSAINRWYI